MPESRRVIYHDATRSGKINGERHIAVEVCWRKNFSREGKFWSEFFGYSLATAAGELQRAFSLSAAPVAQAIDVFQARKPVRDFVLLEIDQNNKNIADGHRAVLLLSTGDCFPCLDTGEHHSRSLSFYA
jgi:hypothetical protein